MKKYLTLMVIPHNESHVREYHLSRPIIWGLGSALGLLVCALLFYAIGYYGTMRQETEFADMQTENAELKRQFLFLQEKLDNIRHVMDGLAEKDRRMRAWVDLSEPGDEVRQMGVGGGEDELPEWDGLVSFESGSALTETYTSMDQLLREARFLEASFDTILSRLNQDEKLRQHLPSISPVHGQFWTSSHFGYRRDPFTGRRQFHNGVDLAGWPGTAIVATANGVVEKASYDKRLGHYVKIDHGYGYQTIYGHLLKRPTIKEGQSVQRGEKVGEMGKTGRATATHVHYSVVRNGRAEDPQKYIFDEKTVLARY